MASINELIDLIKHTKNEQLQRILESKKSSDWGFNDGSTLLHLAVSHNNLELIRYLLANNYNVNAKNSSGKTSLLLALKSCSFEAVKILLDADAEIHVTHGSKNKSALNILMDKIRKVDVLARNDVSKVVVAHVIDNLKRSKLDFERLVELFVGAKWPLKYVLAMNNTQITRMFLERKPLVDCRTRMAFAMHRDDVESVELILRYGDEYGISTFYTIVRGLFFQDATLWKRYIERLYDWKVVNENALRDFDHQFRIANMEKLEILIDSKIDMLIKDKFGVDIRAAVFMNEKVNAIKLLKNRNFDVNAPGYEQHTALHYASKCNNLKNVLFLLDSGANTNAKNVQGKTPIFSCVEWDSKESGQLLLKYGADVQVINDKGMTLFELAQKEFSPLLDFLIAQLAISHVNGVIIKRKIKYFIDSNEDHKKTFKSYCQKLQNLKMCQLVKSVSLFTVLTEQIGRLCRLLYYQDNISLLDMYNKQNQLHPLYYSTLKTKLINISRLHRFKSDMADIFHKITGKSFDFNHLVIGEISQYLTQRDIDKFVKYCSLKYTKGRIQ